MTQSRNYGLDLLRCISMFMIVVVHYLSGGGFLSISLQRATWQIWSLSWLVEAFCYVCVNCFVLLSGYFYDRFDGSYSKILSICRQVWFYSIFFSVVAFLINGAFLSKENIIHGFFPITTKSYWFINVYIALSLLAPFINLIIYNIDQKQHTRLIVILLMCFSFPQTFLPIATWNLDATMGYGIIWFVVLYFIAAYIRRYGLMRNIGRQKWLWIYFVCSVIVFLSKLGLILLGRYISFFQTMDHWWYAYNNFFVLCASVSLFMYFKDITIRKESLCKILEKVSASTLPVLLIHVHPVINSHMPDGKRILWNLLLHTENFHSFPIMWPHMIISCSSIFIVCILVDLVFKLIAKKIAQKKDYFKH